MPAGPIGSSWATLSWPDTAWEAGSWADLGSVQAPSVFGDLTTLFVLYTEALRDANPTKVDTNTLIAKDLATVVAGGNSPDDLNTAYASFLS